MKKLFRLLLCLFCFSAVQVHAENPTKSDYSPFRYQSGQKSKDMKYLAEADLNTIMSERDLAHLTDELGTIETTVLLTEINKQAVAEIEGYLKGRYELPTANAPGDEQILKNLTLDMMKYRLYKRRNGEDIPDAILKTYSQNIDLLRNIAKGVVKLNLPKPNATNSSNSPGTILSRERETNERYTL